MPVLAEDHWLATWTSTIKPVEAVQLKRTLALLQTVFLKGVLGCGRGQARIL